MSEYFEIAYAAASGQLCLFTGTGFSKAVTENEAPSWQGLLESLCDSTPNPKSLKNALFPEKEASALSLDEAAQVIAIELTKTNKNIHDEVAAKIKELEPKGNNTEIQEFLSKNNFKVVTTNYDKLLENLAGEMDCHSLTPGLPVPRSYSRVKIYHVHGSIDAPKNMVVTSEDYFRFINSESYFSRKLSTVLHEKTIVIIGYSLGDTNLKAIISDYKGFSKNHVIGSNIFLISRSKVEQYIKDYYAYCYGIRVLDRTEIHEFFSLLNKQIPEARKKSAQSISTIRKVIFNNHVFKSDYLKIENSFFEIISSLAAIGVSINNKRVVKILGDVIEEKINLTQETGAWTQYEHLARWLTYLASILELHGTSIERIYLKAALHSMTTMRKELYMGYSWHAYKSWKNHWPGIIASNRVLIRNHIEKNTNWEDALEITEGA